MTDNELEYYIRSFRKNVYNAVLCYVRNESDAEDITQITFIKAIPHKERAEIAQSDFSSDCTEMTQACWRKSRNFCAR